MGLAASTIKGKICAQNKDSDLTSRARASASGQAQSRRLTTE